MKEISACLGKGFTHFFPLSVLDFKLYNGKDCGLLYLFLYPRDPEECRVQHSVEERHE